jgi:hypothetical protein
MTPPAIRPWTKQPAVAAGPRLAAPVVLAERVVAATSVPAALGRVAKQDPEGQDRMRVARVEHRWMPHPIDRARARLPVRPSAGSTDGPTRTSARLTAPGSRSRATARANARSTRTACSGIRSAMDAAVFASRRWRLSRRLFCASSDARTSLRHACAFKANASAWRKAEQQKPCPNRGRQSSEGWHLRLARLWAD